MTMSRRIRAEQVMRAFGKGHRDEGNVANALREAVEGFNIEPDPDRELSIEKNSFITGQLWVKDAIVRLANELDRMVEEKRGTKMTSQIPACKDCKYYYEEGTIGVIPSCKFHTFERPDYINGRINKIDMIAFDAREKEKFCGREGKNFEMKEFVEEEETFSVRKYLKEKIVNFLLVLGVLKMEANK